MLFLCMSIGAMTVKCIPVQNVSIWKGWNNQWKASDVWKRLNDEDNANLTTVIIWLNVPYVLMHLKCIELIFKSH